MLISRTPFITFMRVYIWSCIKVITGFPMATSRHNTFFYRLILRAPVSTQKKSVVIEFDNVEK